MDSKLTICSVGDLMICDSPLYASVGVGSKYQEIEGKLFSNCNDVFESADIVIGNFESVVHKSNNMSLGDIQMCCSEDVIKELRNAGFSILNIANNHIMQYGSEGFEETKKTCEKYGIHPIGIRNEEPYIKMINGIEIAFLSLCIHLEWYEPDHILYENRIDKILDRILDLRKKNKKLIIIVSVHWGDEFATYPSNGQIALAHKLVDVGANVILGHHSHVYQGVEKYKDSLIAYSQGNFISDMIPKICRQSGILKIVIETTDRIMVSYELLPYDIEKNYIPCSASGEWIADRQNSLMEVLSFPCSDYEYWKNVSENHIRAHNDFKNFFRANFRDYNLEISFQMICEFIGRKLKRILGTSRDGQVSSMDPEIVKALKKYR